MKHKIPIIIFILLLIGALLFYWFQWRPSETRKECFKYAVDKAIKDSGSNDNTFKDEDYEFRLKYCLQREGLK